jgi:L,D-transpeptidase ErfK/SrfK
MTSCRYLASAACSAIIGSVIACGALVLATATHAATAESTPADTASARAAGLPEGAPSQPADTPPSPGAAPASPVDAPPSSSDAPSSPADTPPSSSDAPSAAPAAPPPEAPPAEAYQFSIDPKLNDEVVGEVQITQTTQQDSLADIARRFSIGYNEMQRANPGVDMWVPGAGRRVVVPTQFVLPDAPQMGIVVNIAEMRLYYFPPRSHGGQQIVYTYPIGIGRVAWKTPSGVTTVVRKAVDPVWRPPADILEEHRKDGDPLPSEIRPGPDDPMGSRALYLGWPMYAIHGTNKPVGVGMRVSHGCMHLYPEDILQLYDLVPVGTPVRVVNQPFVFGWHRGDLYMQAFGPLEGDQRNWQTATRALLEQAMGPDIQKQLQARNEQVRWDLVLQLAHDPQGIPVAITDSNASLDQVLANARQVQNRAPDGALSTDMQSSRGRLAYRQQSTSASKLSR